MEDDMRETLIRAALAVAAFVAAMVVLTAVLTSCSGNESEDAPPRLNGQPLDAHNVVEYDRPVWLGECEKCYRVIDRMTGQRWWLLKMNDGSWVTREDEQVDKQ